MLQNCGNSDSAGGVDAQALLKEVDRRLACLSELKGGHVWLVVLQLCFDLLSVQPCVYVRHTSKQVVQYYPEGPRVYFKVKRFALHYLWGKAVGRAVDLVF